MDLLQSGGTSLQIFSVRYIGLDVFYLGNKHRGLYHILKGSLLTLHVFHAMYIDI